MAGAEEQGVAIPIVSMEPIQPVDADVHQLISKVVQMDGKFPRDKFLEAHDAEQRPTLEALYKLQDQREELEKEFVKERAALEAKYRKLYAPLYQQRAENINAKEGGVPNFWLKAIAQHPELMQAITEKDKKVLEKLEDIQEEDLPDNSGFKLKFIFQQPNSFFSEPVLEKTFWVSADGDEYEVEKDAGCTISWASAAVNPTVKVMKRKTKPGVAAKGPMIKTVENESFFNFFKTKAPEGVPKDWEDMEDEEEQEAIQDILQELEQDYMLAIHLREDVLPDAIKWYSGEALLEMMEEEGDSMFGDDDEDEEGDDDEDEEDGDSGDEGKEEGVEVIKRPKAKKGGAQGADAAECKQQ